MKEKTSKYPLFWRKDDFSIKIFSSTPNISTGILIRADKSFFVADPGDGILRDLHKELSPKELLSVGDIFITHGHHDHIGGIWSFLTYQSVMRRKKELEIHFPDGCVEIVSIISAFESVYSKEKEFPILMNPIENPAEFRRKNISIIPFEVNHFDINPASNQLERVPAFGFKFIYSGKSICYGGDTAYSENLVKYAENSDLAIIEAGAIGEEESALHMTRKQAIEIGRTAKEYFLVHLPE